MKKMVKSLLLTVVAVLSTTVVSSVEAISSDEAVQSALARVPGATVANVTEFNRDYDHGRLELNCTPKIGHNFWRCSFLCQNIQKK